MTNLAAVATGLEAPSGLEAACQSNLRSVNALLDHVRVQPHDFDALLGRILASWHEYLALRCLLLADAARPARRTRELAVLWSFARGRITDRAELHVVDEHVADLATLDPDAMALRYVCDADSERQMPEWLRTRDHIELAYVIIEVSTILEVAARPTAKPVVALELGAS